MKKIKIVQFGLGPIGLESLRLAAGHAALELVGGIDIDPGKAGRTLGELTGLSGLDSARVHRSFDEFFAEEQADLVFHTASSSAAASLTQLRPALDRGLAVVSTCEELIFPALKTPELAREFDAICRRSGARVAAAGVNPGFAMDVLPLCLTGVSRQVDSVHVERIVDAATRRQPLQAKIGSGQDPAAFTARFRAGRAGHAGFQQSVALIAHALGWTLDEIRETCEPVVAAARIATRHFEVAPGQSCGIHQRCLGISAGMVKISLDLQMYLGAPNPRDAAVIRGRPELNLLVPGGVAGDDATVAALVNAAPRVLAAAPGLKLVTELPLPSWSNSSVDLSSLFVAV